MIKDQIIHIYSITMDTVCQK